tara:strand:- start:77 stop:322 length:246 start_codon:yes stop_codon:yes gene_type:complete
MEKKLTKSLNRIKKVYPEIENESKSLKKLTPAQISTFNSLRSKYDLSVLNDDSKNKNDEIELSEEAKITLNRINKGEDFKV